MTNLDNYDELFYLKWNNFQKNVSTQFEQLRGEDLLVDITFACEGKRIGAHRLILFACSPFFKDLLKNNPCTHPVFFMNDVKYEILKAILEYMYLGEVHITNDNLKEFIKTAEGLQIRGLSKDMHNDEIMCTTRDGKNDTNLNDISIIDDFCRKRTSTTATSSSSAGATVGATGTGATGTGGTTITSNNDISSNSHNAKKQRTHNDDGGHHHHHHHHIHAHGHDGGGGGGGGGVGVTVGGIGHMRNKKTEHHINPMVHIHSNNSQNNNNNSNNNNNNNNNSALDHGTTNVEPKVEMVEYLEHEVQHSPTYCSMDSFTEKNNSRPSSGTVDNINQGYNHNIPTTSQNVHDYKTEDDAWIDKTLDGLPTECTSSKKAMGKQHAIHNNSKHHQQQQQSANQANCLTPRSCPVCSRVYSNVSNLRQHMRLIHNPTAVCCPICQKHFNSDLYLKRHYSSIHSINTTNESEMEKSIQTAANPTPWNPYSSNEHNSTTNNTSNLCH